MPADTAAAQIGMTTVVRLCFAPPRYSSGSWVLFYVSWPSLRNTFNLMKVHFQLNTF